MMPTVLMDPSLTSLVSKLAQAESMTGSNSAARMLTNGEMPNIFGHLTLTPKEFLLLSLMARRSGEVLSRTVLAQEVWDIGFETDTNIIDVAVRRLRAKVDDPFKTKLVHTIRGVGYVLKAH